MRLRTCAEDGQLLLMRVPPRHLPFQRERSLIYCRTASASTAPRTSRSICCPTDCASYCAPCQPLLRAFPDWIRSPPPTCRVRCRIQGRCRANSEQISQSRPDSGLGLSHFQKENFRPQRSGERPLQGNLGHVNPPPPRIIIGS